MVVGTCDEADLKDASDLTDAGLLDDVEGPES